MGLSVSVREATACTSLFGGCKEQHQLGRSWDPVSTAGNEAYTPAIMVDRYIASTRRALTGSLMVRGLKLPFMKVYHLAYRPGTLFLGEKMCMAMGCNGDGGERRTTENTQMLCELGRSHNEKSGHTTLCFSNPIVVVTADKTDWCITGTFLKILLKSLRLKCLNH